MPSSAGVETTARELRNVGVITLAEIQKGIEMLADGSRCAELDSCSNRTWVHGVLDVGRPGVPRGAGSTGRNSYAWSEQRTKTKDGDMRGTSEMLRMLYDVRTYFATDCRECWM